MEISQKGIDFIKAREGFRSLPYNDSAGYATVGYGTLLHKSPVNDDDRALYPNGIGETDAEILLRNHIEPVASEMSKVIRVPVSQCQFDALCSLTYNIGLSAFQRSTLLQKLNLGLYEQIPSQFRRWTFAGGVPSKGLAARRELEIGVWEGNYGSQEP